MNLYKISNPHQIGLSNKYSSAIVCAKTEDEARTIHPSGRAKIVNDVWVTSSCTHCNQWEVDLSAHETWVSARFVARSVGFLEVLYIGKADESIESGVILASFGRDATNYNL